MSLRRIFPAVIGGSPSRKLQRLLLRGSITVADYDASLGITGTLNASAWANQIGAAGPLLQATGANQPIVLPYAGEKYAYLPGVAGNSFTTPDSVAASITGSIDIRAYVSADDWTPASNQSLVDKADYSGVQTSYTFYLAITTGKPTLQLSPDGTGAATVTATSSAATGFTDGTDHWLRVTWNATTKDVIFYTSEDGSTWTQLGTTQTANIASIFDGNLALYVGNRASSVPFAGKIYRAQIYNGINGTLAVDYNAADWSETSTNGATQASSTTGEVWTLNNTGAKPAQIVGSASLLFDGAAHWMAAAFTLNQPQIAYLVLNDIGTGWASGQSIIDGGSANTMRIMRGTSTGGVSPNIVQYAGAYGAEDLTHMTLGAYHVLIALFNGASSIIKVDDNAPATGNAGTNNAGGLNVGRFAGGGAYTNIQVKRIILRAAADSAGTQAQIQALLKAVYGTP